MSSVLIPAHAHLFLCFRVNYVVWWSQLWECTWEGVEGNVSSYYFLNPFPLYVNIMCMNTGICTYVRTRLRTYVVSMQVCMSECMYACIHVRMYA